jgi:hypothetical protein
LGTGINYAMDWQWSTDNQVENAIIYWK